jgi:hypothetical protein
LLLPLDFRDVRDITEPVARVTALTSPVPRP